MGTHLTGDQNIIKSTIPCHYVNKIGMLCII